MKKQTALITGSTSGIGLAIATKFASIGYNVVFNGLEHNGVDIAADVAEKYNIEYLFSGANLLSVAAIREMIDHSLSKFGVVDVLINNAGIQYVAELEDFPEEKWDEILAINLSAAFHLSKGVWKGMRQQGFGRIINIASAHGLFASEFKSAYVAAKHGLVGLTKTIALEGAPYGITCNALCPGYVKTPLVEKQIAEQARLHHLSEPEVISKVILSKQAIKDFVPVETIATVSLFLASDAAATITGAALPLDGGWSAQ